MAKAKVVVFDLGNVLLDFDYRVTARKLVQFCTVSEEELTRGLNQSPLLHQFETGLITSEEFFAEVQRLSGFCKSFGEFKEMFGDIFFPVHEMIELNAALKKAGIPTYLFSNTNELAIAHIKERYPFYHDFKGHVLSYRHGVMKPEPRIYEIVEEMVEAGGEEILYIDDRPENVEQGHTRGWQGILHRTPGETIPVVRQALGKF